MQYVNENTDDVFRRAAKGYPLNTDSADWNKVAAVLHHRPAVLAQKSKGQRKYLWLLLLLPFAPVCNYCLENNFEDASTSLQGKAEERRQKRTAKLKSDKGFIAALPVEIHRETRTQTLFTSANGSLLNRPVFISSREKSVPLTMSLTEDEQAQALANGSEENENNVRGKRPTSGVPLLPQPDMALQQMTNVEGSKAANNNLQTPAPGKRLRKFHVGMEAGTGITTVKFQKTRAPGFDLGLAVGYDVSSRLSLEAAVLSSQKSYYADGNAFNTSGIYLPPNIKIASVDGACRMIELPVALQYRFAFAQKKEWFVSVGLSNFFMQGEDYNYEYVYLNSGQSVKRNRTYQNRSTEWLAAAQFSGGLHFKLKETIGLKAEPYVQLPLKGMGAGKLPLTSAGFRLSLVKKLF